VGWLERRIIDGYRFEFTNSQGQSVRRPVELIRLPLGEGQ
jgi:hypothetical protein